MPKTLVLADPARIVCVSGPRTAAQLCGAVQRVAAALPVGPGEEVLVRCEGRYAFTVAVLAAWTRGAVVRLPPDLAPETLARLAGQARAVLHDGQEGGLDLRPLLTGAPGELAVGWPEPEVELVRLSTSGSTGELRTVSKTSRQLLGEAELLAATFGLAGSVVLATVPPRHIYGLLFGVLVPLCAGGAFVDDTPFFGEAIAARLREHAVNVLVTVPAHLRLLAAAPPAELVGLRRVFSSGAPLLAETAVALREAGVPDPTEVFGSTETGGVAWRQQLVQAAWTPLPGVEVEEGEGGRLCLRRSPLLPAGAPLPWLGDDRIERVGEGFVHLGRLDDVLKLGGVRVSLGAVTQRLLALPGVRDGVVVPVERAGRTVLEALVVTEGLDAAAVRSLLRDRLDGVALPRLFVVPRLPRTEHGKLPRAAVLAALEAARLGVSALDQPGVLWSSCAVQGGSAWMTVRVEAEAPWFRGHFPGRPVLPGVAQLHALLLGACRFAWPELSRVRALPRVRFLAPIAPGDELRLSLERDGHTVRFQLDRGEARCTTGIAEFGVVEGG
jgi:acyl-coenzyme A synthetase/AMP-(fatty) acid ligase